MTGESRLDELDQSISSVLSRGAFASTGDEDLDTLARVAVGLRGLAAPSFKARLRDEVVPAPRRRIQWPRLHGSPARSLVRGQRPYLAAGSSCGLVAGACCISGFAAYVLGIAGAATVTSFIHGTLPYFIALSILGMMGWLVWVLREQGITPATVWDTLSQHGIALGTSYATVFASSMALTMAAGLI